MGDYRALHDDASALCKEAAAAQAASCPEQPGNSPVSPALLINHGKAAQVLLQLIIPVQGQESQGDVWGMIPAGCTTPFSHLIFC